MYPQATYRFAPSIASTVTTSRSFTTVSRPLFSISKTTPVARRHLTTTPSYCKLVRPQEDTTTSNQNIKIPTPKTATMSTPISANALIDIIKNRRSYYQLNKELVISKDRIQEIVKDGLWHVPSSFNSQSTRVVVLFGADHDKLWDITTSVLKGIVPEDKWQPTANKMAMFKAAAASVRPPIPLSLDTLLPYPSLISLQSRTKHYPQLSKTRS
jgi:uncharacterized protein